MRKLFTLIALFGLLIPASNVFAETEFNPHYIISDEEMQDTGGWKPADVQTFLDSKGSYLANFRCEDVSSTVKTAAEIIYDAAIRNQISPKFLLVTLQKEQSLITDDSPSQKQLDWATGFAVCDGCELANPKVQKYKGFGKQVDGAASIIRWYYDNQAAQPFIKKKDVSIYIDDEPVIPQTWATAFLYTYTPHLHGNKNFWRIWSTWFSQFYPNGTIVQSASSTDYWLIANGQKRRFKSMTALITRTDPKMAVIMSEADLKNYPDGAEISFPNYSVIKAPSGYYLIDYDTIRPFASADTVSKIGYNPQEILDVSESDLAGYTRGLQIGATSTAPQGVIYKITDLNNSLYLFKDNTLFPITNPALLATNFKNLSVENRAKKDILKYAVADQPVKFADGALLKIKSSSRLYVIENGKKRRMADEQTFLAMGYQKENLVEIDLVNSLSIPEGDPIYVNNALASAKNKYLGDSEAPVSDLFATKMPAYLVAEYPSGKILSGKNIDKQRPIASLVKILTAYEAVNQDFNLTKSTVFNAKKHAAYNNPLFLVTGEKLKNKDILYSALVASVNNAARMMGLSSGLTENSFIAAINTRLEEWGADNTVIADTTGLSEKSVSTPRDLLKIFVTALKNTTIKETMSQTQYSFKELLNKNKIITHNIKNTNQLMFNSNKPYRILASKTGYTDEAGAVLAMLIESKKTKKQYVVLTMGNGSTNRFLEPNRLATWAISAIPTASIAGVNK
jgi:serine-type D-Ala-D-Ala endopeptidase (penicillin-binding protein 7)